MESELMRALEDMVDRHGLQTVLATLSEICSEKDNHITQNWQDDALAGMWEKAGRRVDQAANDPHVNALRRALK